MSRKKLLASAAAVLTAMTMMLPTAMSVSAVQIGTESSVNTEDPDNTEDTSKDTNSETEPPETQPTQSSEKTKTQSKTQTKTRTQTQTEEPTHTTEETEKTTKRTTKKTTKKTTTTTEEETTTTTEDEKNSYNNATVDLSHAGFNEDKEVNVKLKIDSDGRITKARIYLDFDMDILEYKSSKINDDEIGGIVSDSCEDGRYKFEYSNSSGTEFDGTFVTVTFKLKNSSADQTAVMCVVDSLKDDEDKEITNRTVSNAIMTIPESESKKDDSDDDDSSKVGHTYLPLNLSLDDKEIGLDSLGIVDYKTIETDNDAVATVSDGKILFHGAGECKMVVTFKDGAKGYYNIKLKAAEAGDAPEESAEETTASGAKMSLTEDDSNSKKNTIKITVVIVVVCVALILLIVEYFVLVAHRKKKQREERRHSGHRHHSDYEDDEEDYNSPKFHTPQYDDTKPVRELGRKTAPETMDEDIKSYPAPKAKPVNDFEDFLSGGDSEDIKFTGSIKKVRDDVRPDIEDFTLSQGGFRN